MPTRPQQTADCPRRPSLPGRHLIYSMQPLLQILTANCERILTASASHLQVSLSQDRFALLPLGWDVGSLGTSACMQGDNYREKNLHLSTFSSVILSDQHGLYFKAELWELQCWALLHLYNQLCENYIIVTCFPHRICVINLSALWKVRTHS